MTCIRCKHENVKRFGKYGRHRIQRYRCQNCKATFSDTRFRRFESHYLSVERTAQIVSMMVEGVSLRAISRLTDVDRNTVLSILLTVGAKCESILNTRIRRVRARYLQLDETWSFVHTKEKRVKPTDPVEWGDAYTWIGLDSETRDLLPCRQARCGVRQSLCARSQRTNLRTVPSYVRWIQALHQRGRRSVGR